MTRAGHMAWAKQRAMEYVNDGHYDLAVASMLSDLRKHPETEGSVLAGSFIAVMVRDRESAKRFVEGFQ